MKSKYYLSFISAVFMTYTATASSPYAPTMVGTSSGGSQIGNYTYDTTGNRLSNGREQTIAMGLINKVETITTDFGTETLRYGTDGQRYIRVHADGRKRLYVGDLELRIPASGNVSEAERVVQIHPTGYSPTVQVNNTNDTSSKYTYFVQDHLGSPVVAVDDTGTTTKRNRFAPLGQATDATGVAQTPKTPAEAKAAEDFPGFTGHEFVAPNMGNWNARFFDYELGMFTGPDKFIQGRSIASLNRFGFGHNNSPNVTDPSGNTIVYSNELMRSGYLYNVLRERVRHSTDDLIRSYRTNRNIFLEFGLRGDVLSADFSRHLGHGMIGTPIFESVAIPEDEGIEIISEDMIQHRAIDRIWANLTNREHPIVLGVLNERLRQQAIIRYDRVMDRLPRHTREFNRRSLDNVFQRVVEATQGNPHTVPSNRSIEEHELIYNMRLQFVRGEHQAHELNQARREALPVFQEAAQQAQRNNAMRFIEEIGKGTLHPHIHGL